eukprot:SAG22_NODE_2476_length_2530_cov_2.162896_5_plen_111_part_00
MVCLCVFARKRNRKKLTSPRVCVGSSFHQADAPPTRDARRRADFIVEQKRVVLSGSAVLLALPYAAAYGVLVHVCFTINVRLPVLVMYAAVHVRREHMGSCARARRRPTP